MCLFVKHFIVLLIRTWGIFWRIFFRIFFSNWIRRISHSQYYCTADHKSQDTQLMHFLWTLQGTLVSAAKTDYRNGKLGLGIETKRYGASGRLYMLLATTGGMYVGSPWQREQSISSADRFSSTWSRRTPFYTLTLSLSFPRDSQTFFLNINTLKTTVFNTATNDIYTRDCCTKLHIQRQPICTRWRNEWRKCMCTRINRD